MEYPKDIHDELKKHGIRVGDHITVERDVHSFTGILMPKSQGDASSLIIKLDNGYNVGIDFRNARIRKEKGSEPKNYKHEKVKYEHDPGKPTVAILTTGGTIVSRIDYKSGAVTPLETPEELVAAIPELRDIANVKIRQVFQMASDDVQAFHWMTLARKIADEIDTGVDGIIITHGTDTMHYTAAALSLMVQNPPIPILLVGSQRSSDRGSSDAAMNLLCAAQFIAGSDFAGVAICMHGTSSDDFCHVHQGTHVRKMHTSRRDTFRSIDVSPFAKVEAGGSIEFMRSDYPKKDKTRKPNILASYDDRAALVKIYPGFDYRMLVALQENGYRGIVLEGTGLGHAPINATDDATASHTKLLETIKNLVMGGMIIGMTSQCAYGKVNMNVYSPGRILQLAGVVPLYMTPETALVKMGWALGQAKDSNEAKKMLTINATGEILERIDIEAFEQE